MMWRSSSPDRYTILKAFAKENRRNATLAENVLWGYLCKDVLGATFLRQHIIGDYTVDFMCRKPQSNLDASFGAGRLIIEVDGGYHAERQQQEDDKVRQSWLEEMGFRVIRFTNEQVLYDTENTVSTIKQNI